jgi:hypothetical protein
MTTTKYPPIKVESTNAQIAMSCGLFVRLARMPANQRATTKIVEYKLLVKLLKQKELFYVKSQA